MKKKNLFSKHIYQHKIENFLAIPKQIIMLFEEKHKKKHRLEEDFIINQKLFLLNKMKKIFEFIFLAEFLITNSVIVDNLTYSVNKRNLIILTYPYKKSKMPFKANLLSNSNGFIRNHIPVEKTNILENLKTGDYLNEFQIHLVKNKQQRKKKTN